MSTSGILELVFDWAENVRTGEAYAGPSLPRRTTADQIDMASQATRPGLRALLLRTSLLHSIPSIANAEKKKSGPIVQQGRRAQYVPWSIKPPPRRISGRAHRKDIFNRGARFKDSAQSNQSRGVRS